KPTGDTSAYTYFTYRRPLGATMLRIILIGAGGGGGSGFTRTAGNPGGGGGGGGPGAIASALFCWHHLPDVLYMGLTRAVPGGTSGAGGSGQECWVMVEPGHGPAGFGYKNGALMLRANCG